MNACRRTICGHHFSDHTKIQKFDLPETISRGGKTQHRIRILIVRGCANCACTHFSKLTCDRLGKFPGDSQYRRYDSGGGEVPR